MKQMIFAKEKKITETISSNPWKVLIVDDEEEVHQITKTILDTFTFENQKIKTYSAYSGKEAIEVLEKTPDIALILLDVVMESDDAGLIAVKRIRNELNNKLVRIILRTGQPGSAPEQEVIRDYDINDYKEKTELTSAKLYTSVISSLRSYKDISIIEQNRKGLKAIIESSSTIFKIQSFKKFAQAVLEQLLSLMEVHGKSVQKNAFSVVKDEDGYHLLAASGHFQDKKQNEVMSEDINLLFKKAIEDKKHIYDEGKHVYYFETKNGTTSLFYFVNEEELSDIDKSLIDIFSVNVSIAFENINLNKDIFDTQKELIEKLGEVIETRSNKTAIHVKRVTEVSYLLAKDYGLSEETSQLIKLSSPMHNIEGEEVHIYAQITMLVDVFDALVHKRVYKKAWSVDDALKFIEKEKGRMFDPKLVEVFFDNINEIKKICCK